jgi:pimeloyl-ACP methyl ester carboxylesterase
MQTTATEPGFAPIENARLYYELAGEGSPFVMIHAGVADCRQWNREFAAFADHYRVLRYDMRGYGKSEPVEGKFSHMGDLITLLDHIGIDEPLVLMGCSMGGGIALNFALTHPSRVRALIMVGSGPNGLDLDVPDHPKAAEAEEAFKSEDYDRVIELDAQIWFDGMKRTPEQVNLEMRTLFVDMDRIALTHELKKLGERVPDIEGKSAERLGELKIPVLVIVGDNDIPFIQGAADFMAENIASARKVVIRDAAHLCNMDHPEAFEGIVREFLEVLPE